MHLFIYDHCTDPASNHKRFEINEQKRLKTGERFIENLYVFHFPANMCSLLLFFYWQDRQHISRIHKSFVFSMKRAFKVLCVVVVEERHHNLFYCTHLTAWTLHWWWIIKVQHGEISIKYTILTAWNSTHDRFNYSN